MNLVAGEEGAAAILRTGQGRQGDRREHPIGVPARPYFANQIVAVALGHADVADQHLRIELFDFDPALPYSTSLNVTHSSRRFSVRIRDMDGTGIDVIIND